MVNTKNNIYKITKEHMLYTILSIFPYTCILKVNDKIKTKDVLRSLEQTGAIYSRIHYFQFYEKFAPYLKKSFFILISFVSFSSLLEFYDENFNKYCYEFRSFVFGFYLNKINIISKNFFEKFIKIKKIRKMRKNDNYNANIFIKMFTKKMLNKIFKMRIMLLNVFNKILNKI